MYMPAAVTDNLENTGTLQQLRAQVRAGIYQAIESPQVLPLLCLGSHGSVVKLSTRTDKYAGGCTAFEQGQLGHQ